MICSNCKVEILDSEIEKINSNNYFHLFNKVNGYKIRVPIKGKGSKESYFETFCLILRLHRTGIIDILCNCGEFIKVA